MSKQVVRVEMSRAEANALWHAAGNSIDAWEDALGVLGNAASARAAYRAHTKLGRAITRAERGGKER